MWANGEGEPPLVIEDALLRGCNGGRYGGDFEIESSLVILLLLSELFMATARASALRLELNIVLFEIPPLLLFKGKLRFLFQT